MKLHIMGASGSGVTTLGSALATRLNVLYFDSDDYFWEKTDPPFKKRREPALRNKLLLSDCKKHNSWILGGSLLQWNLEVSFDLIIFLYIPNQIRMERLHQRELDRYGYIIYSDQARKKQYDDFIAWANGYDDNTTQGRNLASQESWLQAQTCPVLDLRGNYTVDERIEFVLERLKIFQSKITY